MTVKSPMEAPESDPSPASVTRPHGVAWIPPDSASIRRFRLTVVEGPQPGRVFESSSDACAIGSHLSNDLQLDDDTVSRFHCEVRMGQTARVKDLDSLNGVVVDGVRVADAFLRGGSLLRLGRVVLRFDFSAERNRLQLSERTRFGSLVGSSVAMRHCFALLERASQSDATVLLEGETGTGKSRAAQAIHASGARRERPFVVVDCGAIPGNLLESELFGHEKGSFTGAVGRRVGAFEEAAGGTVFLDEVGELTPELQPKLLRVIEEREIKRVGGTGSIPVDVRVIAATHRDLRAEVNAARFRSDLFYRLAVVRIPLPSLRQRAEDLPLMVDEILSALRAPAEAVSSLRTPEFLARLQSAAWPGNVRELRNYLERCLVFQEPLALENEEGAPTIGDEIDASRPYGEARRRALERFEQRYVQALLERHQGRVSQAASAADIDRVYLYRLVRRHGLKPG